MEKGIVKWYNNKQGIGFIESSCMEEDILLHFSEIKGNAFLELHEGDSVCFELGEYKNKKPMALNIRLN